MEKYVGLIIVCPIINHLFYPNCPSLRPAPAPNNKPPDCMAQLLHDSPALLHAAGSTLFLTNHPNLTARNVPVSGFDLLCRQRWCRGRRAAAAAVAASGGGQGRTN